MPESRWPWVRWIGMILLGGIAACQPPPEGRSFCYWQTQLHWDTTDTQLWQELRGQHLYLRCFDVDWSSALSQPIPRASLEVPPGQQWSAKIPLVPVFFLVNRSLEKLDTSGIKPLAEKIWRKLLSIGWRQGLLSADRIWTTVLVDCDWTAATQSRYFALLRALQRVAQSTEWQCTLRLHQYSNANPTNIPPVNRVLLMCYNTDPLARYATTNAILDLNTVKKYLQKRQQSYPRQMDLALPLFFWGAWFRGGQFQGLLRNWSATEARQHYLSHQTANRWRVTRDTVVQGCFLRQGDEIRADGPTRAQLRQLERLLEQYLRPRPQRVVWFDWERKQLHQHRYWLDEAYHPR